MIELGVIEKAQAQAICDAVKEKEGSTEPIPFNVVADRITALKVGGGENKLVQLVEGTLTEITAKDLEGATQIKCSIFVGYSSLQRVILPNTITEIDVGAFERSGVSYVEIPNSVTLIGTYAFNNCQQLQSAVINGKAGCLQAYRTFSYCPKLTSVYIGSEITNINAAFNGCEALTDIYIDNPEGSISGAPWGATNATIHWNTPLPSEED